MHLKHLNVSAVEFKIYLQCIFKKHSNFSAIEWTKYDLEILGQLGHLWRVWRSGERGAVLKVAGNAS